MPDRIRLDGRVAVVTGAAGVIGTATIRLLAERGARIVAVDRKPQDLQTAVRDLPASAQALAITADVTSEDEVAEYVRTAVDKFGAIDVFHNNAGIEGDIAPITRYSLETFRKVIDVNVVGVFLGLKHVLPVMLKQNKGSIINTASIAGLIGSPEVAVYSASKHAVIGLTKSAAQECSATGGARDIASFDYGSLRKRFSGAYVANNGYDFELANKVLAANAADLIAFGKPFIANPDLVERLKRGAPLNEPDKATFYGGGAKGYTDYPALDEALDAAQ